MNRPAARTEASRCCSRSPIRSRPCTRLDAITPTSVMVTIVTTNPAPGIERWSSPSMRWKSAQHTQSVTATGAVTTSPRRKYAISFRMLVGCVRAGDWRQRIDSRSAVSFERDHDNRQQARALVPRAFWQRTAVRHLKRADPVLAGIIERVGPSRFVRPRHGIASRCARALDRVAAALHERGRDHPLAPDRAGGRSGAAPAALAGARTIPIFAPRDSRARRSRTFAISRATCRTARFPWR